MMLNAPPVTLPTIYSLRVCTEVVLKILNITNGNLITFD